MTAAEFSARILLPSAARFTFRDSPEARALLLAIAGQESGWSERVQDGGPARGFWQFEEGGVHGVLTHPASKDTIKEFCSDMGIPWVLDDIHEACAWCDPLAYALARLLLWTDPRPLPALGDQGDAWNYYDRNWKPGRPRGETWGARYAAALAIEGPAVA